MLGAQLGLSVWCEDEAGPFQAVPHPGGSWQPREHPATQPHEYIRGGTTKILTLFHPATGQVRLQSAERCTNAVLHPWLREHLSAVLDSFRVAMMASNLRVSKDRRHVVSLPAVGIPRLVTWRNRGKIGIFL